MPITQGDETTGRELVTSNLLSHMSGSRWLLAREGCLPVARGTGNLRRKLVALRHQCRIVTRTSPSLFSSEIAVASPERRVKARLVLEPLIRRLLSSTRLNHLGSMG